MSKMFKDNNPDLLELHSDAFTWEAFEWAYIIVLSRYFNTQKNTWAYLYRDSSVPKDHKETGHVMYPAFDL
jgi:hypothetical protein